MVAAVPFFSIFHECGFDLEVTSDETGIPQSTDTILRLDAPDFEPAHQTKGLRVPPGADSSPCTFLIKPSLPGELVANFELLKTNGKVVASRSVRTNALQMYDGVVYRSGFGTSYVPLKEEYEKLRRARNSIERLVTLERRTRAVEPSPTCVADAPIAVLVAETGNFHGQSFTLTESMTVVSIGHSVECEIRFDPGYGSRVHSKLRIEPAYHEAQDQVRYTFTLIDCGSLLGTRLNGKPIVREKLRHGDRFEVGAVRFRFVVLDCTSVPNRSADS
jgi:hypothetical protein